MSSLDTLPESAGFLNRVTGAAIGRSTMIPELTTLLGHCPADATPADYRAAIVDANVLGKPSRATRIKTFTFLRDRYLIDPDAPLFRGLRSVWDLDETARPLLAMLLAMARDPILRVAATVILPMPVGTRYDFEDLRPALTAAFADTVRPASLDILLSRQSTCWFQSGHLHPATASPSSKQRRRDRATSRPAAVAWALWLGHLEGLGGDELFTSRWVAVLDASRQTVDDQAAEAARQGLIDLRRGGGVTSVGFRFLSGNGTGGAA